MAVRCAEVPARNDNARISAGAIRSSEGRKASVLESAHRDSANVRAIEADIGQFTIAELGQFADVAMVVAVLAEEANDRQQHSGAPLVTIQCLKGHQIVEMNIGG